MSPRTEGLLLIAAMIAISMVFQVQLKIFADSIAPLLVRREPTLVAQLHSLVHAAFGWRPALIVATAALLLVLWLLTLTRLELSYALPLASVGLIVNAVGGGLLLGEPITLTRLAGLVAVAAGVGLVLKS